MTTTTNFALLHGGGQGGWVWDETVAALERQGGDAVRVIAFDLPGCGAKRGQDTSKLTVRDVAAAFVADLEASGMREIVLVGHSNAGTILPLVAELRPDLIRRYVYVSCIAPPPGVSIWDMKMAHRDASGGEGGGVSGGRLREMFANDMDPAYADAFMAKLGQDRWPTLEVLHESAWRYDHLAGKPSTFVICLQDRAETPEAQEQSAALFQVQRRVRIDAGHQAMNTRPEALAEILLHEARVENAAAPG
ncbi:MAG: alpha/beta fold hydrolase [Novosphingobium sp.]